MRRNLTILLSALLWLSTASAGADPASVRGVWLTEEGEAKIEITSCASDEYAETGASEAELCGKIVWLEDPFDEKGRPDVDDENPEPSRRDRLILGMPLLWGFAHDPESGRWQGGEVYDPENGKTYDAKMWLEGDDVLNFRGYLGLSLFGRTTEWTRSDPPPAEYAPYSE